MHLLLCIEFFIKCMQPRKSISSGLGCEGIKAIWDFHISVLTFEWWLIVKFLFVVWLRNYTNSTAVTENIDPQFNNC